MYREQNLNQDSWWPGKSKFCCARHTTPEIQFTSELRVNDFQFTGFSNEFSIYLSLLNFYLRFTNFRFTQTFNLPDPLVDLSLRVIDLLFNLPDALMIFMNNISTDLGGNLNRPEGRKFGVSGVI